MRLNFMQLFSEVILAVGSSVGQTSREPGNQAELFYPYSDMWADTTRNYPNVHAIWMSPMIYIDGMFIMFGGRYRGSSKNDRSTKLSNLVMKFNETYPGWSKLGELFQDRSSKSLVTFRLKFDYISFLDSILAQIGSWCDF